MDPGLIREKENEIENGTRDWHTIVGSKRDQLRWEGAKSVEEGPVEMRGENEGRGTKF